MPLREGNRVVSLWVGSRTQSLVLEASVLQEIGEFLRESREAQGMTLEDIENMTRIRRRYLEAIENGDFSQMPGEVQLRGFIRNYAAAVGLDPSAVVGRYLELRGVAATISDDALAGSKTEILVVEERRSNRLLFVVLLLLLIAAAGALYYFLVYAGPREDSLPGDSVRAPQQASAFTLEDVESQPVEPPVEPPTESSSDPFTEIDSAAVEPDVEPGDAYEVRVVFGGTCWYKVEGEGVASDEGFGRDGDEKVWVIPSQASLRLGNAGHVSVFVDGEPVRNEARLGEVRVLQLPVDGASSQPSLVRP